MRGKVLHAQKQRPHCKTKYLHRHKMHTAKKTSRHRANQPVTLLIRGFKDEHEYYQLNSTNYDISNKQLWYDSY